MMMPLRWLWRHWRGVEMAATSSFWRAYAAHYQQHR